MTARYARAPSEALLALLDERGFLGPLRRRWMVAGLPLDLQLRERDQVHLYCGLTRLVAVERVGEDIKVSASSTYTSQICAQGLFRTWKTTETGFNEALGRYLYGVEVSTQWTRKEGAVQAQWMATRGPWIAVDREVRIGRDSTEARTEALDTAAVHAAFTAVDELAQEDGWKRPSPPAGSNKLDQLGVDRDGRMVLVELKRAHSADLTYAPLQALRYAWEWHEACDEVLPGVQALVAARRDLGLTPLSMPDVLSSIRVAVAWGGQKPSKEVRRRLLLVKGLVDAHLPPGVDEVELWALPHGKPIRRA